MVGAHFDQLVITKLPVDFLLPTAALEQANPNLEHPLSAWSGRNASDRSMTGTGPEQTLDWTT